MPMASHTRSSVARGFPDDQPAVPDFDQVEHFAAGNCQSISAVILTEFGSGFGAIDRDAQVTQLDADGGFAGNALASLFFPILTRLPS